MVPNSDLLIRANKCCLRTLLGNLQLQEVSSEDQDFLDSLAPAPGTATTASSDARPAHLVDSPPSPPFDAPDLTPRPDGHPEGSSSSGGGAVEPASDGERLPSPPKRQLSKQMSVRDSAAGAAWVAPPPRAFFQFQKVCVNSPNTSGVITTP